MSRVTVTRLTVPRQASPWLAYPWLAYLRDRHLPVVTLVRLAVCIFVVVAPFQVSVPTSSNPLPLEAFLALAFAVPSAVALPERLQWLGRRWARHRLRVLRSTASLSSDVVCIAVILFAARLAHHTVESGGPLLALGIGYASSTVSSRVGWLAVAAAGSIGLLTFGHSPVPIVDQVPSWVGASSALSGAALYVVLGPRDAHRN